MYTVPYFKKLNSIPHVKKFLGGKKNVYNALLISKKFDVYLTVDKSMVKWLTKLRLSDYYNVWETVEQCIALKA